MAELSYFWDGTTVGDATQAPYSYAEVAEAIAAIYGDSFVIPEYLNNLEPVGGATMYIDTGAAQVLGYMYINNDYYYPSFDAQGGGNNRIDRIVLRLDTATQTVRLTIIKGVAAATPDIPALTAVDAPVCWVYLYDGFGGGGAVNDEDVHNERQFVQFGVMPLAFDQKNQIPNAEFMGYSCADLTTTLPEQWNGTFTSVTGAAAITEQPRGRTVEFDIRNAEVVACSFVAPEINLNVMSAQFTHTSTLTFKGKINVTSGDVRLRIIAYDVFDTIATTVLDKRFNATNDWIDIQENLEYSVASINAVDILSIYLDRYTADTVFTWGPMLLVKGYVPGPFRQTREIILFKRAVPDATWAAYSPGAASITSVNLTGVGAAFGSNILSGTRNVLLKLYMLDPASAANPTYAYVNTHYLSPVIWVGFTGAPAYLYANLQGVTNSQPREVRGWVSCYDAAFSVTVLTATSDTTLTIVGIST